MKNLMFSILLIPVLFKGILAQNEARLEIEPYTFENRKKEKVEAELGTLYVPENREKANSPLIKIRFVRFKSHNPNPGAPIVYLAGGPGGSGTSAARGSRFSLFMALREVADVIAFDQRGTGMSDRLPRYEAYASYPNDEPLNREKASALIQAYTRKARTHWDKIGLDLAAYNTNSSADDLNDLRKALGVKKISLWGISYGTHLSLATLKKHEQHLDKVILAGVEGLDHTVKLPANSEKLLKKLATLIDKDLEAKSAFPDFLGDLQAVLESLDKEAVELKAQNPWTKETILLTIGKFDVQLYIANSLRGPQYMRYLPQLVKNMKNGDFSGLVPGIFYGRENSIQAMSAAMDMASGISPQRKALVEAQSKETLLAGAINFPYFAEQASLGIPDLGEAFRSPVKSDVPVLCISGTMDGRTPVSNAMEVLEFLPNGQHIIIEGAGHSDPLFLSSPKILENMRLFLNGKPIKDPKITLPPMTFVIAPEK